MISHPSTRTGRDGDSARSQVVLVLGMHRSGTSAVTRTISLLGASLPKTLMKPVEGNNDTGFWESKAVVALNERILKSHASGWYDWRPAALQGTEEKQVRLAREILKTVDKEFGAGGMAVLKDPRVCRLATLYLEAFDKADRPVSSVIVLRHPAEVAGSLQARDGLSHEFSHLLWLAHMLAAERATRNRRRTVVSYEAMLNDPPAAARRLAEFLDLPDPEDATLEAVREFLRPDLRHHVARDGGGDTSAAAALALAAFSALSALAAGDDPAAKAELDRVGNEFDAFVGAVGDPVTAELLARYQDDLRRMHDRLLAQQTEAEKQRAEATKLSRSLQKVQRVSAEADEQVRVELEKARAEAALLQEQLDARERQLLQVRLSAKTTGSERDAAESELKILKGTLRNLEQEITRIRSTRVWRWTLLPRRLLRKVVPSGRFHMPLRLEPAHDLKFVGMTDTATVYDATGGDPYFLVRLPEERKLPRGRYRLHFRLPEGDHFLKRPRLYVDAGAGFSEKTAVNLKLDLEADDLYRADIVLPSRARMLRFDPSDQKGRIAIGEVHLERYGGALGRWSDAARALAKESVAFGHWIRLYDTVTDEDRWAMAAAVRQMASRPLISVIMPTYNTPEKLLREVIASVQAQTYENWELCIADDASTQPHVRQILEEFESQDPRIRVVYRSENGHISRASNSAIEIAKGEWIALLDHDDLLAPHALFCVAEMINRRPDAQLIYSDEDKVDEEGNRSDPYFKCDWNLDLFRSHNLITHLGVYRRDVVNRIGGFRAGLEGAQDYDLALRYIEAVPHSSIVHIPHILYHWRVVAGSTALANTEKPYAMVAGERALNEHLSRMGMKAQATLQGFGYRVQYDLPPEPPLVTLMIPTRNGLEYLRQCIGSVVERTTYPNYEILIIDNGSDDPECLAYMTELQEKGTARVYRDERPFNYAALNNEGASRAKGDVLALVNNDIEVVDGEWLSEMVSIALQPGVGAVGARLWYPNDTLQHGGVIMGLGGLAAHAHHGLQRGSPGYVGRAALIQSFSAVTAACLVVRKDPFFSVGGFDEQNLAIAYNDVDLCLKLRAQGLRNVWTPYADLYHHESATRGYEISPEKRQRFEREKEVMRRRWPDMIAHDPAYNPNLTVDDATFSIAFPPRVEKPWRVALDRAAAGE